MSLGCEAEAVATLATEECGRQAMVRTLSPDEREELQRTREQRLGEVIERSRGASARRAVGRPIDRGRPRT
ncbi:hypothetical protein M3G03_01855 [Aestuariimicrobium sp. p3-SID1156]|uniref:hypothetical protein n=1 Tax=Aestuariimicrobium sp. p3-SID1156 TaxID=2916038 RepID=UPI00223B575B|nr:hypothetical protein [Aestuariimicrobium sp. p3-SID1156]MCT1458298.1 hypothetical protein [Aestuariimicrobium sp. p3-SID1156]